MLWEPADLFLGGLEPDLAAATFAAAAESVEVLLYAVCKYTHIHTDLQRHMSFIYI